MNTSWKIKNKIVHLGFRGVGIVVITMLFLGYVNVRAEDGAISIAEVSSIPGGNAGASDVMQVEATPIIVQTITDSDNGENTTTQEIYPITQTHVDTTEDQQSTSDAISSDSESGGSSVGSDVAQQISVLDTGAIETGAGIENTMTGENYVVDTGYVDIGIVSTETGSFGIEESFFESGYLEPLTGSDLSGFALSGIIFSGGGLTGEPIDTGVVIVAPDVLLAQDVSGRLLPESVFSFVASSPAATYCSAVAKWNLQRMTEQPVHATLASDGSFVGQGDASELVQYGLQNNLFIDATLEHDMTGLLSLLQESYVASTNTIFDLYLYKRNTVSESTAVFTNDAHRFVVFLGSDEQWYVLDPVRTLSNMPVLLSEYYQKHIGEKEDIYLYSYGYKPALAIKTVEKKDGIVEVHSVGELAEYALSGDILAGTDTLGNPISATFLKTFRFVNSELQATLPSGGTVKTANNQPFDLLSLGLEAVDFSSLSGLNIDTLKNAIAFGIPGQHLIFTKPVKLVIPVPSDVAEGTFLQIMVKHEGTDSYTNDSLSSNGKVVCGQDGTVDPSERLQTVLVHEGLVSFYTCGASTFIVNAGGTGNISLWIKADTGINCITSNCSISQWNDISGVGNTARQSVSSAQPLLQKNLINGHSAVNFDSAAKYLTGGVGTYRTIFAVRNAVSTSYQTLFAAPANTDFSIRLNGGFNGTSSLNYTDGPNGNDWSYNGGQLAVNGLVTNVGQTGYHILRAVSATPVASATYSISSSFMSRGMAGLDGVAELIAYNTGVDSTKTNQIESYLAIKYGITLDQTTPRDYVLSDGTVAWNASLDTSYKYNIFGIARDDETTLNQKVSDPQWSNILTISLDKDFASENEDAGRIETHNNNLQSILFADDNGSLALKTTEVPTGYSMRIAREWLVQKTTNFGESINMLFSGFGSTKTGTWYLLGASDSAFSSGITVLGTLDTSGIAADVVFSNNTQYITLAETVLSPGGVAQDLVLWNRADMQIYSDSGVTPSVTGTTVLQWNDISPVANVLTQSTSTRRPAYWDANSTRAINYNPVVAFNGTAWYMQLIGGLLKTKYYTNANVYVVSVQDKITTAGFVFMEANSSTQTCPRFATEIPRTDSNVYRDPGDCSTSRVSSAWGGTAGIPYIRSFNKNTVNTPSGNKGDIKRNAKTLATSATTIGFTGNGSSFYLGSTGTANFFSGKIAEVIVFAGTGTATLEQENRIESYLAIKYGITLEQSSPTNYTLSDGTVARDASMDTSYQYDIAGIARDDRSALMQRKSQSIHETGDIIVWTDKITLDSDKQSLMRANNNASISIRSGVVIPTMLTYGTTQRVPRERLFQETGGDIGDVTIALPNSGVFSGQAVIMLIDADGDFSSGNVRVVPGNRVGPNILFTANIANGEHITFAKSNLGVRLRADARVGVLANISAANRSSNGSKATYPPSASLLTSTTARVPDSTTTEGRYLQMDIGSTQTVVGVITKGRGNGTWRTTSYKVSYSIDGVTYSTVDTSFSGNANQNTEVINYFSTPISARYVRIIPLTYSTRKALRADLLLVASDGATVRGRGDVSATNYGATTAKNTTPTYRSLGLNFNPAVEFDTDSMTGLRGFYSHDYFVVYAPTTTLTAATAAQAIFTTYTTTQLGLRGGSWTATLTNEILTHKISNTAMVGYVSGTASFSTPMIANFRHNSGGTGHELYYNDGYLTTTAAGTWSSFSNQQYIVGSGYTSASPAKGKIAEVISYTARNDDISRDKIASYLAIKYGITLDQTTLNNYVNGNNVSIYTPDTTFDNNIFGITKDLSQSLDQRVSTSINPNTSFVVSTDEDFAQGNLTHADTLSDRTAVIFGDDNLSNTGYTTGSIPSQSQYVGRVPRTWKYQNTNVDAPVNFLRTGLTALVSGQYYGLLIDTDSNFTNGGTTLLKTGLVSTFTGVSLPTGTGYMTVVYMVDVLGTLCISGADIMSGGGITAKNTSQSIEIQSAGYFQVEDLKGSTSGYYTTLSISTLTGDLSGLVITPSMIDIKADPLVLLSGTANTAVVLDSTMSSYSSLGSGPKTFIKRNYGSGANIMGTYGSKIRLRFTIPAYQGPGTYTGTLTYTLYEN